MKNLKQAFIIWILLMLFFNIVSSDCSSSPSFIKQIKTADFVGLVECQIYLDIRQLNGYKIIEHIKSNEKREVLFLWGSVSYGPAESFGRSGIPNQIGDTSLIAVKKHKKDNYCEALGYDYIEKKGTYYSTVCGNNYLEYKNGLCTGWITNDIDGKSKPEKMEYEELKKLIIDILEEEKKIKPDSLEQIKQ